MSEHPTIIPGCVLNPHTGHKNTRAFQDKVDQRPGHHAWEHLSKHVLGNGSAADWALLCPGLMRIADITNPAVCEQLRRSPRKQESVVKRLYEVYEDALSRSVANARNHALIGTSEPSKLGLLGWVCVNSRWQDARQLRTTLVTGSLVGIVCIFDEKAARLLSGYLIDETSPLDRQPGKSRETRGDRDHRRHAKLTGPSVYPSAQSVYERIYCRFVRRSRRWEHLSRLNDGWILQDKAVLKPMLEQLGDLSFEEWKSEMGKDAEWRFI